MTDKAKAIKALEARLAWYDHLAKVMQQRGALQSYEIMNAKAEAMGEAIKIIEGRMQ